MTTDVLGWVQCICHANSGAKRQSHSFLYPCQVTIDVIRNSSKIMVPCEHLQMFFEVMMGQTLLVGKTIASYGYEKFLNKIVYYYVARMETCSGRALPT